MYCLALSPIKMKRVNRIQLESLINLSGYQRNLTKRGLEKEVHSLEESFLNHRDKLAGPRNGFFLDP